MTALDWSDGRHWSDSRRPCRHCGFATNLRDEDGRACHKVCAEAASAAARRALANSRGFPPP